MATNKTEIKQGRYAAYIDSLITISAKSQATIAKEIGYKNPNNLSLIKSGKVPLPIDKVRSLAKALNADPVRLMLMVLEERHPELLEFFRDEGTAPLSDDEKSFRSVSQSFCRSGRCVRKGCRGHQVTVRNLHE